jgi:hypothetical protein
LNEAKPEKVDPFYKKVRDFHYLVRETPPLEVSEAIVGNSPASKSRRDVLQRCYREFRRFYKAIGLED